MLELNYAELKCQLLGPELNQGPSKTHNPICIHFL